MNLWQESAQGQGWGWNDTKKQNQVNAVTS